MSLFQLRECWSARPLATAGVGDDQLDAYGPGCAASGALLPPPAGHPARHQIVVAGLHGTLYVYDPGSSFDEGADGLDEAADGALDASALLQYRAEHLLLEQDMLAPVLHVCIGRFTTAHDRHSIAVLQPRRLAVYVLSCTRSAGAPVAQGSEYKLHQAYEHQLHRAAYNMTTGPFGGAADRDYMCVQSLDGELAVFEQETHTFGRFLPGALIPGPVAYVPLADSFVTVSSGWFVESYTYQTLAVAADQQESSSQVDDVAVSTATGKRVAADWSFELGTAAVGIAVVEVSPAQPSIVVLAERAVFCLTEGGTLRFAKRLDYRPLALLAHSSTSEGYVQYMVASESGTLLLYADTTLRWTVRLPFAPVHLLRLSLSALHRGLLAVLSASGALTVGYLGTEPALYTMPHTDNRLIDYNARLKELRQLQHAIRANVNQQDFTPTTRTEPVSLQCTVPSTVDSESHAYDTRVADGRVPSLTVTIRIVCKQSITDGQMYVRAPQPLAPHQHAFYFAHIGTEGTELPVTLFARDTTVATSWRADVKLVYRNAAGVLRVASTHFTVPLCLLYTRATGGGSRQAAYKATVETSSAPVGLDELLPDVLAADTGLEAPVLTVVLQQIGADAPPVTVMASKNTQRYRVQSDALEGIGPILSVLVSRLRKRADVAGQPMNITYADDLPLSAYFALVDSHFELQKRQGKLADVLEQRCSQLTAIERRLMLRFKESSAGGNAAACSSLAHMDTLFELTQRQVLSVASAQHELAGHVRNRAAAVEAATRLLLLLLQLKHSLDEDEQRTLEATLCPVVDEYPEQTWQQRVDAGVSHMCSTLAKGHGAGSSVGAQLPSATDTNRFKKHVTILCDRIAKMGGLGVAAKAGGEGESKDAKPAPAPVRTAAPAAPARQQAIAFRVPLEPIAEDGGGDEASEPAVASFAAVLPAAGATFPPVQQQAPPSTGGSRPDTGSGQHGDNDVENGHIRPMDQPQESTLQYEASNLDESQAERVKAPFIDLQRSGSPNEMSNKRPIEAVSEEAAADNSHGGEMENEVIPGLERPMSTAQDRNSDSDEGF